MSESTAEKLFEKYASEGFSGDAAAVAKEDFIAAISELAKDKERLDWLESHSVETGYTDDEPGERAVWTICGRNDRVWNLAGTGETLREALDKARKS